MNWRWTQIEEWLKGEQLLAGAEIGVKEGRFIAHMLSKFPSLVMYAIDPWETQPEGNETYEGWDFNSIYNEYRDKVSQFKDRVIELREYSETAADKIPDKSLDFVFIDAQHDYDSVKEDIALWLPKVIPGGLLCGHDYEPKFPGVVNAVDDMLGKTMIGRNATWGIRL